MTANDSLTKDDLPLQDILHPSQAEGNQLECAPTSLPQIPPTTARRHGTSSTTTHDNHQTVDLEAQVRVDEKSSDKRMKTWITAIMGVPVFIAVGGVILNIVQKRTIDIIHAVDYK
ncbi:hypothetical protein P691DRAFT_780577 [Macrolepiota fuliginosa MF-IS2]|uniref:Uncharacterized protein n=1 Tax=Macrolepiota fuliginosa MF-IS2 TaxID=1400762 RepID=A0A9P6C1S0_9AGAR|nr:hypothetical protein P691DRAFT_780577 [Macrolepiota fuliginosa MF-IS2]